MLVLESGASPLLATIGETQELFPKSSKPLTFSAMKIDGRSVYLLGDYRMSRPAINLPHLSGVYVMLGRSKVFVGDGLGAFQLLFRTLNPNCRIHRVFPVSRGWLVQYDDPLRTALLTLTGSVFEFDGPNFPWHGSFGVGRGFGETVIFSEYQAGSSSPVELGLWRMGSDDLAPGRVFSAIGGERVGKILQEIRHFHTVFPDPYSPGTWYASSGDSGNQNKLWLSTDDGRTFVELELEVEGFAGGQARSRGALRFTSARVLSKNHLVWATDDGLGSQWCWSCVARVDTTSKKVSVQVVERLARNWARNLISEGSTNLVLTESKTDFSSVDFVRINNGGKRLSGARFENKLGQKSPVTTSFASPSFKDGVAFFRHGGSLDLHSRTAVIWDPLIIHWGD